MAEKRACRSGILLLRLALRRKLNGGSAMPKRKFADPKAVKLTKKLGEDHNDPIVVWNVECGLHSGFPECCIAFYMAVWWPVPKGNPAIRAYLASLDKLPAQPGYIPCPECLRRHRFVKVRRCRCALSSRPPRLP